MIINSKDNKVTQAELAEMGVTQSGYSAYLSTCYTCSIVIIGIVATFVGGVL